MFIIPYSGYCYINNYNCVPSEYGFLLYVEIKGQLDETDDFYCRSYCLLNMFQELESIIQVVAACRIWCFGFQVVGMMWS